MISSHDINNIPCDQGILFMPLVNKYIPLKFKYIRSNPAPFINKPLRKAIMLRSKLKNCYLKDKNPDSFLKYKIQRNICTNLLRRAKRVYFSNLKCSVVTDNKNIWKSIKPIFSDKCICSERITLVDDNNIITNDDISLATTFDDFFSNTVKTRDVKICSDLIINSDNIDDPVLRTIYMYSSHPSILKIKKNFTDLQSFSFKFTTFDAMFTEIKSLNPSKAIPKESLPIKVLQENIHIFSNI